MSPAFAGFQEPHAWLIRGLVEYGWPDVTRASGRVPPDEFGGFDLTRFSGTQGRDGFSLCVPALADGSWLQEDGVYDFIVKMTRSMDGQIVFMVRCPEANFLEEFPFDSDNPQYVAGYIHQSLTRYVPDFVRWRQSGGEVTWAQRAGMPEIQGEPSSSLLSQFINERVNLRRSMDVGPEERWWMDETAPSWSGGDIASVGRAAENERNDAGELQEAARFMAESTIKAPAAALTFFSVTGLLSGLFWLGNIVVTLGLISAELLTRPASSYIFSIMFSFGVGFLLLGGGAISIAGARSYRRLKGSPLVWFSMAYVAASPLCCALGIPMAGWALYAWSRPEVKAIRAPELPSG